MSPKIGMKSLVVKDSAGNPIPIKIGPRPGGRRIRLMGVDYDVSASKGPTPYTP
jgi:hypothetical protein